MRLEETVKELRATSNASASLKSGAAAEVVAKKDAEILAIKSQAEGLQREYNALADRYEALEQQVSGATPALRKDL